MAQKSDRKRKEREREREREGGRLFTFRQKPSEANGYREKRAGAAKSGVYKNTPTV